MPSPHNSSRKHRLRWLAAAATAAALTVPTIATADASPTVNVAVASYAADYSVTHQEAQRRLDRIQPLQEILARIRSHEGARLAGWGIDHTGTFTGWVWLTGDQPPSASAAAIANTHSDIEIRAGAVHTLKELLKAQTGLFRNIGPLGQADDNPPEASQIQQIISYTDIDMTANSIVIGIDPDLAVMAPSGSVDSGPISDTDEAMRSTILDVTQSLKDHVGVEYIVEDGRGLSAAADFKAGEPVGGCTSGFTAKQRNTNTYGIIVAAHCTNTANQTLTMHGITLVPTRRAHGPYIDAQFQSIPTGSSHRIFDDYLCEERDPCDVSNDASRAMIKDSTACHYGRISRETCGTVASIFFMPTNSKICSALCNNSFIRVEGSRLRSCTGDSGGPWYYDGTAYGIHSGHSATKPCTLPVTYAFFSPIQAVERILGVDILTDGFEQVS